MKFLKFLIAAILLISVVFTKKTKKTVKKHPTQTTRNYRKGYTDISFNPLMAQYSTGPLNSPSKYPNRAQLEYTGRLANVHTYKDQTQAMRMRLRGHHAKKN